MARLENSTCVPQKIENREKSSSEEVFFTQETIDIITKEQQQ